MSPRTPRTTATTTDGPAGQTAQPTRLLAPLYSPPRVLAVAAVTVAALSGVAGPASADEPPAPVDCAVDNSVLLASAETAVADAKAVRLAANRPLGRLMQEERREARAEVRAARPALRDLRAQARDRDLGEEERTGLLEAIEAQVAELRHAQRLLESKRALLAEVKAERTAAKATLAAARAALQELRTALEACEPVVEDPEDPEDPED